MGAEGPNLNLLHKCCNEVKYTTELDYLFIHLLISLVYFCVSDVLISAGETPRPKRNRDLALWQDFSLILVRSEKSLDLILRKNPIESCFIKKNTHFQAYWERMKVCKEVETAHCLLPGLTPLLTDYPVTIFYGSYL